MNLLRVFLFVQVCFTFSINAQSQNLSFIDSLKQELTKPVSNEKKLELLTYISRILMTTDKKTSDEYGQ